MKTVVDPIEPLSASEVCTILNLESTEYLEFIFKGDLRSSGVLRSTMRSSVPLHTFWDILEFTLMRKFENRLADASLYRQLINEFLDILAFEIEEDADITAVTLDNSIAIWLQCISVAFVDSPANNDRQKTGALMRIAIVESLLLIGQSLVNFANASDRPNECNVDMTIPHELFQGQFRNSLHS